jgi:hypothetical protein
MVMIIVWAVRRVRCIAVVAYALKREGTQIFMMVMICYDNILWAAPLFSLCT